MTKKLRVSVTTENGTVLALEEYDIDVEPDAVYSVDFNIVKHDAAFHATTETVDGDELSLGRESDWE